MRLVLVLVLSLWSSTAWAAPDASVVARLSTDTVEAGTTFNYSVTAATTGNAEIRLEKRPDFGALSIVGQQQMPQFITINGRTERRVTLSFTLRADKTGDIAIEPPVFLIDRTRYTAEKLTVRVVPRGKAPAPKARRTEGYFIEVSLQPKNDPWVGQQLVLSYDLYSDATALDTVARQMTEPSLDEFWIEDLSDRTSGAQQVVSVGGRLMERKGLRTYALFPLRAGPAKIDPMTVDLVTGGFFRQGREVQVASEPIALDVKPLPPDAPASFDEGNVGDWEFAVRSDQSATRVGRAVRVEVAVQGEGQLGRVKLPALPTVPGARISDPDTETRPVIRNMTVGGVRKEIYSVTPLKEGTLTIPALEFSHFDPDAGKYVTTRSEPVEIRVAAGELPPEPVATDDLNRRAISGGEDLVENLRDELRPLRDSPSLRSAADPSHFPLLWWFAGAASLLAFVAVAFRPRFDALRERRAPIRARKAAHQAAMDRLRGAGRDPAQITSAVRDYLAEVHDVPRGTVTSKDIARSFRRRELPEDAAEELAWVLEQCESARFGPTGDVDDDVPTRALAAIDQLSDVKPKSKRGAPAAVAFLVAGLAALSAPRADAVVLENPDSVDALYNHGTQAALDEDYATARWALERAAWLDPGDADVIHNRDIVARIVRLQAIEQSRTGRTMDGDEVLFWWRLASSIPPWAYGLGMVLGWLLAAALVMLRRRSESAAVRDAAFVGTILALTLAVFATVATIGRASVLDTADPVVVSSDLELRTGPNTAARVKRTPESMVPGTLIRATDRRDDWVKLVWPTDAGWTRSSSVRSVR